MLLRKLTIAVIHRYDDIVPYRLNEIHNRLDIITEKCSSACITAGLLKEYNLSLIGYSSLYRIKIGITRSREFHFLICDTEIHERTVIGLFRKSDR